jgi:hypothetical protein
VALPVAEGVKLVMQTASSADAPRGMDDVNESMDKRPRG